MSDRYWRAKARTEAREEHVYNKIAAELGGIHTFNQIEAAAERAKQDGICIQTYGDPKAQARMLSLCEYL